MKPVHLLPLALLVMACSVCAEQATLSVPQGSGPNPQLPAPNPGLLPTVNIAPAVGWPAGGKPTAAAGTQVSAFAEDLDHPRWLYVLPNGDVLVAESNAPAANSGFSLKGWIAGKIMARAGAGVPSANRITLLRDSNHDGVVDLRTVFLHNLHSPFGMALVGNDFYVANADSLLRFPYVSGQTQINAAPSVVTELPSGINHHWTKNVVASPDGSKLYATVGSNSNVGENGIEAEAGRAAIVQYPLPAGPARVFASGLRNPNGLDFEPATGLIWTAVNERDMLGDDLVPDYMTSVRDGDFFGWPYSYYGQHVDSRVKPARPDLVAKARAPDYALGPHTASLGLTFYRSDLFPARYKGGAFVGQHGSWNRRPPSGYRVVFVPFAGGKPSGPPEVFLTGFLNTKDEAQGRPVGVVVDKTGALLVADDVGKAVWRVAPTR